MGVRRGTSADSRIGWWLVVFAAVATPCTALTSAVAGSARILYFEPLRSISPPTGAAVRKSASPELQQLHFDAYGRRFELSLEANGKLTQQLQAKTGNTSLRLYRGEIDGVASSWVRLAVKGSEVHGMIWDGAQLYVIEPAAQVLDSLVPPLDADASDTVIFRLADVLMDSGAASCATETSSSPHKGADAFGSLLQELKNAPAIMQAAGSSRRLEISALGDSPFLQRHASAQDARDEILLRLNNVDGIFSAQLGVEIQVPSINVNDPLSDPLSDATSPTSLLSELAELRKRSPDLRSRGLTHLFTGRDLDDTTVGIAYLDSLCDQRFGVGLTEVSNRGSWVESLIAAHEIGHNFGAVHDGDPEEACESAPSGLHLMSPSVNGHDTFSQCSLDLMRPNVQTASCITALPPADIAIPADLGTAHEAVSRPFEWDLTVVNSGGTSAINVRAEVFVPPALSVEEAYVVGGSCTSGAGVIFCQLGDLPGSVSRIVHLTLRSDVIGSSSISARITAQNETQTVNNNGDGTIMIEPEADLAVSLQAPSSAATGETFDLGFSVVNRASIQATGISVLIDVPAGISASNASLGGSSCITQSSTLRCTLPSLAPGATANGSASFNAAVAGNLTLRTQVSGSYVDPDSSNDSAERTINVTGTSAPAAQTSSAARGGSGGGGSTGVLLLLGLACLRYTSYWRAATPSLP